MSQRVGIIFLSLFLLVGLAGCQAGNLLVERSQKENGLENLPSITAQAVADKVEVVNEAGLLSVLAAKTGQADPAKYLLHDVKVNGDFIRGRFSYGNALSPQTFWASLSAGAWTVVFVGEQAPDCQLLRDFPPLLQSGCRADLNVEQVSNFNDCLQAGFPCTAEQPRRCVDAQGNIFVEVAVASNAKRYVSQDVVKCRDLDFDCAANEKSFLDAVGCGCQGEARSVAPAAVAD